MKIQDEARWLAQRAELGQKIGPQSAQSFIAFVEDWCEGAERIQTSLLRPIEALRAALEPTEVRHGFLDTNLLANMLVVICANWAYGGDDFFVSMTEIEQRLVIDVAGQMIAEQQDAATGAAEFVPDESVQLVPTADD